MSFELDMLFEFESRFDWLEGMFSCAACKLKPALCRLPETRDQVFFRHFCQFTERVDSPEHKCFVVCIVESQCNNWRHGKRHRFLVFRNDSYASCVFGLDSCGIEVMTHCDRAAKSRRGDCCTQTFGQYCRWAEQA